MSRDSSFVPEATVTLKPGDLIEIPERGTMQVGRILQPRVGTLLIRLDQKFKPSLEIRITTN